MTHILADRVADTTSTTGTVPFVLDGLSYNGYRNFAAVCSDGDTIWYSASHRLLNQWEVGKGTYGAGTGVLTRTTILASSNSGSAVNFSSGTKDIVAAFPSTALSGLAVVPSVDNAAVRFNGTDGAIQSSGVTIDDAPTANIYPTTSDGGALGTSSKMWSDLFLAAGSVINWNNGDVLLTHSTNKLAFSGANNGYTFDKNVGIGGVTTPGVLLHMKGLVGGTAGIKIENADSSQIYGWINGYNTATDGYNSLFDYTNSQIVQQYVPGSSHSGGHHSIYASGVEAARVSGNTVTGRMILGEVANHVNQAVIAGVDADSTGILTILTNAGSIPAGFAAVKVGIGGADAAGWYTNPAAGAAVGFYSTVESSSTRTQGIWGGNFTAIVIPGGANDCGADGLEIDINNNNTEQSGIDSSLGKTGMGIVSGGITRPSQAIWISNVGGDGASDANYFLRGIMMTRSLKGLWLTQRGFDTADSFAQGAIVDDSNSHTTLKISGGTHTYGIDLSGGTYTTAAIKTPFGAGPLVTDASGLVSAASYAFAFVSFRATAINFNSANNDNGIAITLPTGYTRYRVQSVIISHASHDISTATCGVFTAAAGGGTNLLSSSTITVTATADATNNNMQTLTLSNNNTTSFTAATLYFRTLVAEGAAATADVTIVINPLP